MKAQLEGHPFDLDHLTKLLPTGDVMVVRDGDRYHLTAPEIDNPPAGTKFHKVAERLIVQINGLGRTTHSDFRPVRLTGTYDDDGGQHIVVAAATLSARACMTVEVTAVDTNGNVISPQPSPGPNYIAVATKSTDVAEALEIMGQGEPPSWVDLYKVHEIVREGIKPDTIVGLGWATRDEQESFRESACHPDVSGKDARHARRPRQPKHQAMSLAEGRQFIRGLVTNWLDRLV